MTAAAVVILTTLTPYFASAMGAKPPVPVRQESLMVRFKEGVTEARIGEIWTREKILSASLLPNVGLYIVSLPAGVEALSLKQRLETYPEVRYVEMDARAEPLEGK